MMHAVSLSLCALFNFFSFLFVLRVRINNSSNKLVDEYGYRLHFCRDQKSHLSCFMLTRRITACSPEELLLCFRVFSCAMSARLWSEIAILAWRWRTTSTRRECGQHISPQILLLGHCVCVCICRTRL